MEFGTELSSNINEFQINSPNSDNKSYNKIKEPLINSNNDTQIEITSKEEKLNNTKIKNTTQNSVSNYYFFKILGKSFSFFGNKHGDPLIIIGPNWAIFIFFSMFISFLFYLTFIVFWEYIGHKQKTLGIFLYSILYLSYIYTVLINQGFPKNDDDSRIGEPRKFFKFCKKCKIWTNQQKNTFHCNICDICVEEYDHHCIWTSKCIGKGNICSFQIFVIFTCFSFFYTFVILFIVRLNFAKSKSE